MNFAHLENLRVVKTAPNMIERLARWTSEMRQLCTREKGEELTKAIPELALVEITETEVGEPVEIETPSGTVRATWLGTVSNGKELAEACRLMVDLERERAEKERAIETK